MNKYQDVIRILGLEPLPFEGGLWKKSCFSDQLMPDGTMGYPHERPFYGAIYYLLTPDTCSLMHRIVADEIWYHHSGPAVRLLLIHPDGKSEIKILGQDLMRGERPQIRVKRGTWQGAALDPGSIEREASLAGDPDDTIYTLMSTSMAPEYLDSDFEAGTFDDLKPYVHEKDHDLLRFLTGDKKEY